MKTAPALLLTLLLTLSSTAVARAQSSATCGGNSTLRDTYSPADTKRAEDFLLALKASVAANDKAKVANMVKYPVRVNLQNHTHRLIRTPQQFRAQYDWLFNANTRKAIDAQVPQCMFARDQGAMIGDGQIWFQDFDGAFRIWSFNHM